MVTATMKFMKHFKKNSRIKQQNDTANEYNSHHTVHKVQVQAQARARVLIHYMEQVKVLVHLKRVATVSQMPKDIENRAPINQNLL